MSDIIDPESIKEEYLNWLLNKVELNYHEGRRYLFVGSVLHKIEFYWTVANDDNRSSDGYGLRNVWFVTELKHHNPDILHEQCEEGLRGACSMLEMMIALALRMENDFLMDGETDRTANWFWLMMENLGLDKFDDEHVTFDTESEVYNRVLKVLDRTFDPDGTGGLFPLENPPGDQRETEIWYQACNYIQEKGLE